MNRNGEDQWQCPFCKSIGTFEPTYLGAFPHVYQYTCTECGVSGPTGNGQTKKAAILDAKNEQIKFLNGYYELELANKELIKTINQACNNALDLGYCDMNDCANCNSIKAVNKWKSQSKPTEMDTEK
jgi:hypothetical protein